MEEVRIFFYFTFFSLFLYTVLCEPKDTRTKGDRIKDATKSRTHTKDDRGWGVNVGSGEDMWWGNSIKTEEIPTFSVYTYIYYLECITLAQAKYKRDDNERDADEAELKRKDAAKLEERKKAAEVLKEEQLKKK